ncbi:MAG: 50S ribosomal protein L3 [Limnochordaceae bacterium]|nr:50S ribosomal protein L3 [Limnochordaceae bacterium]
MAKATAGLLGRKVGMTQVFGEQGEWIPVTVLEVGPCPVVQKKTVEKDGYSALQLGFGAIRERLVNKPRRGHFARAQVKPVRWLREIRWDPEAAAAVQVGQELKADLFSPGERVDVIARSKGKGFAGVIKRFGNRRGPMSHGSMYHRRVGTLGATAPQRVLPGKKMPGRMGGRQATVLNMEVVRVDAEANLVLVRGAVPGPRNGLVLIRRTLKGGRRSA